MTSERDLSHQYQGDGRMAKVMRTDKGLEVDLFDENGFVETREVHGHSYAYAEDVAYNWLDRIIT